MALKNVGQLKDHLSAVLEGVNIDTINDLNGSIEQAARTLLQQVSIPEATGRQAVTLYGQITDYAAPGTLFGTSLVDFRPQGISRGESDKVYKKPIEVFDRTKHNLPNGYTLAIEYKNGVAILRVGTPNTLPNATLDAIDSITDWTVAGSASGLTLDKMTYYKSPASFRFLLTGASTGTLTKAIASQNLSDYEDVGVAFVAIRTPSASNLTSVTLRLGSSASTYDEVSVTTGFLGAWTADEWTILAFDFSTATSTGTPDWSAIDYAQLRVAHGATITNFRVGALFISLPSPHELIYETAAIFKASGASPSQTITDDSDSILLSDPAYLLFEKEVAITVEPKRIDLQQKLYGSGNDIGLYGRFRGDNPPAKIKEINSFYRIKAFKRK